jgi:hypothetical protein
MYKYMDDVRRNLKKSHYKDDLVKAILGYVRALDEWNWNDAFIRLWGVLEFLTHSVGENHKVTTKKASYLDLDREYSKQILLQLRYYRNNNVHSGLESNDIETFMYQLKRFVEGLIKFHIFNPFRFQSLTDAAEFMNLPDDKDQIDEKIRKLRFARNLRFGQNA